MASPFVQLLGDSLVGKGGVTVSTEDAVKDKTAIALYFSAHWCPPCRGFTPQLAEKYSSVLQGKGLEIIFVSSDKDEAQWKDYHGEMPWLALPYADRDRKNTLSTKYKVRGIPTLVIVDMEGNLITADGRSKLEDLEGYPWTPKSVTELLGDKFEGQHGATHGLDAIEGKILGLYFSAHWCPPCRGFTPELVKTYNTVKAAHPNFEILFLSSDRDEDAFKEYFAEMPWLALPYEKRKEKEELSSHFEVNGIPSLIILGADGAVINKNARSVVGGDPAGDSFPWAPKLVNNIGTCCDGIDERPALILLADELEPDARAKAEADLNIVAKELKEKAKAAGSDDNSHEFFIATSRSDGPIGRVTELCEIAEDSPVKAILLDIPSDGAFYEHQGYFADADAIRAFLTQFADGALERKQLKQ